MTPRPADRDAKPAAMRDVRTRRLTLDAPDAPFVPPSPLPPRPVGRRRESASPYGRPRGESKTFDRASQARFLFYDRYSRGRLPFRGEMRELPRRGLEEAGAGDVRRRQFRGATTVEAPPELRAGLRILVVDDHQGSAEVLSLLLRRLGHQVETANDGSAALGVAERFRPEIALLDLVLPDMDGYEVSRRLRAMDFRIRLLALSGYPPDERSVTFDEHLMKPISLESLQGALDRWRGG